MAKHHIPAPPVPWVREAMPEDVPDLAALMQELGYPTSREEMKIRFENIFRHPDYTAYIAGCAGEIAGMIGLNRNYAFESNGCYIRISALIVKASCRNLGIGKLLMDMAEHWANQMGADFMVVNSGDRDERKIAHQFYQKLGFIQKTSGFRKMLEHAAPEPRDLP
jgi:GNAT superfamily N-acetyltransferase